MRVWNGSLLSGSVSGSTEGLGLWLGHIFLGSMQLTARAGSAGLIGSMSLVATNEAGRNASEAEITITTGLNYWVPVGTPVGISLGANASGSVIINLPDLGYRWIKPQWTHTSGTGSIEFLGTAKGL